jgi:hypothetical protein
METVTIKVKKEFYNFFLEIRDKLDPSGKTKFKTLKNPKKTGSGTLLDGKALCSTHEDMDFEIPKCYLNQFNYINDGVSNLSDNEKIVVITQDVENKCLFCGSNNLSKEHIFPQWMRDYFKEKVFTGTLYARSDEEDLLNSLQSGVSKGKESSYGYTSPQVCVTCNTTWMSNLEEKVKAILVRSSTDLKTSVAELGLNEEKSQLVALWLLVKAVLLAQKDSLNPTIPENSYEFVRKGKIPASFMIEITDCDSHDLNYIVNKGASALGSLLRLNSFDRMLAEVMTKDFFMVSLQIGNFLFRVSYFDESNGLKREVCIKPTISLFPYKIELPFNFNSEAEELWKKTQNSLKLHIFNIGLSLTDF